MVARRTIEGEGELDDEVQKDRGAVSSKYLPINAWAWKALGVVELVSKEKFWWHAFL